MEDWRLIYQLQVPNIAFLKRQQWVVTNYGILLYAAFITIARIMPSDPGDLVRYILSGIALFVAGVGVYLVGCLHKDIALERKVGRQAREHLSPEVQRALDRVTQGRRLRVSLLLSLVLGLGALVTAWLLIWHLPSGC